MAEKKPAPARSGKTPSPPPPGDPANTLRQQMLQRLLVAGSLVAALLAILAFFDYLASSSEEPEAPVFAQAVPVPPRKELSQPVTATTQLPEPPASTQPESKTDPQGSTPAKDPAIPESLPPPPAPSASPGSTDEHPETVGKSRDKPRITPAEDSEAAPEKRPLSRSTVKSTPFSPAATRNTPVAAPIRPRGNSPRLPDASAADDVTYAPPLSPDQRAPSARVVQIQPAPGVVPPHTQRLFSGFVVQAGVFNSAQRAEEIHARLTLSGVPSTLETRVQVGPFRTRQEAEIAQEKLRELGIQSVLISPRGNKP